MEVALITPTRDRSVALQLCFQWLRCQRLKKDVSLHWIVCGVPGGDAPGDGYSFSSMMETKWPQFLMASFIPGIETTDPVASFRTNLSTGLECAGMIPDVEVVIFIEDDDYYAPGYVQACIDRLAVPESGPKLVGEAPSRYFHIGFGASRDMGNVGHASLSCTAFHRSILDQVKTIVSAADAISIDCDIWRSIPGNKQIYRPEFVVGMKGLPGTPNLGVGGSRACYGTTRGPVDEWDTLSKWIGVVPTAIYFQVKKAMEKNEAQDASCS